MSNELKTEALRVLDLELKSISQLKESLDSSFFEAVDLILNCSSKVIITGIGKSGLIGRKISSTLSSTGTPSLYLHPAESSHGDLGVIQSEDVVIAISKSGEVAEMSSLYNYLARKGIPLIAMTAKPESSLAKNSTICLNIGQSKEACPLGLAPTSSTTSTLVLGDILAMCLLKARGFSEKEFAEYHPGGALGRKLLTRVKDVMLTGDALPLVSTDVNMSAVVSAMTGGEARGVVGIIDENKHLVGIVTDGDIRRSLVKYDNALLVPVTDIMSTDPKTIDKEELTAKARFLMDSFQIQSLFVVDKSSSNPLQPVGHIRVHNILNLY